MKLLQILVFTFAVAVPAHGYSFTSNMNETTELVEKSGVDKYPYVADVRIGGVTACVATLIAPQYLITTAHCIRTNEFAMTASFDVEYNLGSDSEVVKIVKGFKHPFYNKRKHLYDVGLLKLEKPSKEKVAALPAVDGSHEKVGTIATVLGWKLIDETTDSFKLHEANLPIISETECGTFRSYKSKLTEGMLCAGKGDGKGSCRGDAGGPLIVDDTLVGFVSWAEGKCGMVPGVYTRVSSVLDYINDVVGGGDGNSFGLGRTSSGSSKAKELEATTASTSTSAKTTTTTPDGTKITTADFSLISSVNQQTPFTQGVPFSFDGSTTERKDAFTKAPATINSDTDTEQQ